MLLGGHAHQVEGVVGAAALPRGAGEVGGDGLAQPGVRVGGHESDPGQAAGDEVGEELVPRGAGFRGGHPHAEDFAVAVAVDAGSQQHHGIDDAAAFADLHRQRVGGHEREGAGRAEGPVAEVLDELVEVGGHPGDLGLRQRVDPQRLDELVHAAGADAGEVAVRDHGDQRGLGSFAALEEPLGEVGALAELGDRDLDGADPGVQVTVAVAVALARAPRCRAAPLGADDGVGIGRQERVDDRLQQRAHQIGAGFGQGFAEQAGRVDNVWCGHRDDSVREICGR